MDMKSKTCCFTGHRQIPKEVRPALEQELEQTLRDLTAQGVVYYGAGGALGFDTLAAQTVLRLLREFPQIRLILVLPCPEQTRGWRSEDVAEYQRILSSADKVVYVSDHYDRGCMHRRNRHLVDHSGTCVAYCARSTGGTAYTVRYARSKGLPVLYLGGASPLL